MIKREIKLVIKKRDNYIRCRYVLSNFLRNYYILFLKIRLCHLQIQCESRSRQGCLIKRTSSSFHLIVVHMKWKLALFRDITNNRQLTLSVTPLSEEIIWNSDFDKIIATTPNYMSCIFIKILLSPIIFS